MGKAGVLIVEDDDATREVLVELLTMEGYGVYEAPDGKPALERMRTHPEGLVVLLDLWMPGIDGLAVLSALAADSPLAARHVYILMTAVGKTLPEAVRQLVGQLNVSVVLKPFEFDTMLAAIEQAASRLPGTAV